MELEKYFKAIIDADNAPVVVCNLEHDIIYMNPAAANNYEKYGGSSLVGQSILDCHNPKSGEMIIKVVDWFCANKNNNVVYTFYNEKLNKDVYMVALRDTSGNLIGYYEKHEFRTRETMKMYDFS